MDDPRAKWNDRYRARPAQSYPPPPSPWLAEHVGALERAREAVAGVGVRPRALDCACGAGRNAIHLARLGFTVDALDISDVAITQLATVAAEHELAIDARVADLEAIALPANEYAAIVVIDYLQRDLYPAVAGALASGGIVIAETFTRAHIEQLGHDFDPRFVLEPGELRRSFPGLEVVAERETLVDRSGRQRAVASVVARRPVRSR